MKIDLPFDLNNLFKLQYSFNIQYSFDTLKSALEFLAEQQATINMKVGLLADRVTDLEKRPILDEEVEGIKKLIALINVKVDALEKKQPLQDGRMDEFDDWKPV